MMIEKFLSLAVNVWSDGGWNSEEGKAFVSARRDLYEITDLQYADVVSIIDKLENGLVYLGRAVDLSTSTDAIEAEALEYCTIKGCAQYAQSLVKVFIARRAIGATPDGSVSVIPDATQPTHKEKEHGTQIVEGDLHVDPANRLWFDFAQVVVTNLEEFDRLARSKKTCTSLLRSNFEGLCSKSLGKVAEFLTAELVKRGNFDDWNSLFEDQAEMAVTFANEVDEKVHEIASEAQDHASRFQAANRQDPNHKFLSFSALGVIAGVGSLLSEVQRNSESTDYANDINGQLAREVAPAIQEIVRRMFLVSTDFYDSFAEHIGLLSYQDMTSRQDRAAALTKNIPKITDPMVAAGALSKIFEIFPFQNKDFVRLISSSSAPDAFKRELRARLEPYLTGEAVDGELEAKVASQEVSTIRKIVSSYRSMDDAKVWITTDVPAKKLAAFNAGLGSALRVSPAEVVLYYDDTVFGKGDDGMLISDEHVIFRIPFDGTRVIILKKLAGVKISGILNKTIAFTSDGGGTKFTFTQNNDAAKLVFEVLERYLAAR